MTQDYTHKVGDLVAVAEEDGRGTLVATLGIIVFVDETCGRWGSRLSPYKVEWADGEYHEEYYTEEDIETFKEDLKKLQRKRRKR